MSTIKKVLVRCDEPDCDNEILIDDPRQWEARVAARAFGWVQHDKLDECPDHTLF